MKVRTLTLQKELERLTLKHAPAARFSPPLLRVLHRGETGFSTYYAGWAYRIPCSIAIMDYVLADKKEALSVLRHEFAHVLKEWLGLLGSAHGKGFNQALKLVSGKNYNYDRHWHMTPAIARAFLKGRKTRHTRAEIKCEACGHIMYASKVLSYISRGLFVCPGCKVHPTPVSIRRIPM